LLQAMVSITNPDDLGFTDGPRLRFAFVFTAAGPGPRVSGELTGR